MLTSCVLGMTKFHSSRLFLPEGRFIVGNWLEYRDMAAYEACDKVWQESGAEFAEKYGHLFEGVTVRFDLFASSRAYKWLFICIASLMCGGDAVTSPN